MRVVPEMAPTTQAKRPSVVVLGIDHSLTRIEATQENQNAGRSSRVDVVHPDFGRFAAAFGVRSWRAADDDALGEAARRRLVEGAVKLPHPTSISRPSSRTI